MSSSKKKTLLIIIILLLALLIGGLMIFKFLLGRKSKPEGTVKNEDFSQRVETADPVLFTSFEIRMMGTEATRRIVHAEKTVNGAFLEYYLSRECYNSETKENDEIIQVIRRVEGDEDLYNTLCKVLGAGNVFAWDGFAGNNSNVLDGESGSFEAILPDGKTVNATGNNKFPSHFKDLFRYLVKLATVSTIDSTTISNNYFSVQVPAEWIGVVYVSYSEDTLEFFITDANGSDRFFLIFNFDCYWYGGDEYAHVGILKNAESEDELMIIARNYDSLPYYYDSLTDEQKVVSDTFDEYQQSIIESLSGLNGYALYPEE